MYNYSVCVSYASAALASPYLNTSVGAEVEVKLIWVCYADVHCGPSWDIATATHLQKQHSTSDCYEFETEAKVSNYYFKYFNYYFKCLDV